MNEKFKNEIKKKDGLQKKFFLAFGICLVLAFPLSYVSGFLLAWAVIFALVFFVLAVMSGRSIADDVAVKISESQEKEEKS